MIFQKKRISFKILFQSFGLKIDQNGGTGPVDVKI